MISNTSFSIADQIRASEGLHNSVKGTSREFESFLHNDGADSFSATGVMGHARATRPVDSEAEGATLLAVDYQTLNLPARPSERSDVLTQETASSTDLLSEFHEAKSGGVLETTSGKLHSQSSAPNVKATSVNLKSLTADAGGILSSLKSGLPGEPENVDIDIQIMNTDADGPSSQDITSLSRSTSRGVLARMPLHSNAFFVALHNLEAGLRVFARVQQMTDAEKVQLMERAEVLLAEYGLSGVEIEIVERFSENDRKFQGALT